MMVNTHLGDRVRLAAHGMSRRGKAIAALATILVALLVCIGSAYYMHPTRTTGSADIDFMNGTVPASYKSLRIGMTEEQVRSTIGNPAKSRTNPRYEVKSDAEWIQMKAALIAARSAQQDPSGIPNEAYLKLGTELEHRVKEQWIYYPNPSTKIWVSMEFDGHGKLISAASGPYGTETHH